MGKLAAEKRVTYIIAVENFCSLHVSHAQMHIYNTFEDLNICQIMEHLRMNWAYWGLITLDLLGKLHAVDVDEVVSWIISCQHESGGFGSNVEHDPYILYTLSAVQVLALFDKLDVLDIEKLSNCVFCFIFFGDVPGLQNENGSFSGDEWGEVDTRFSYIAICCLSLLRCLDKINVEKAKYIVSCKNLDGGFGSRPAGSLMRGKFSVVLALLLLRGLFTMSTRTFLDGGYVSAKSNLEVLMDTLRNFQILIMIDRVHWINKEKLVKFILDCQDTENGGIPDGPDDAVDVYHTFFGVAGLSLLEHPGLKAMDPAYALFVDVVNRFFLRR